MNQGEEAIPIGAWIRMSLPGFPDFISFTYVDRQAGLSAKGSSQEASNLAEAPAMTVRLPMPGVAWNTLTEEEIRRFHLPQTPSWVEQFYGPQPKPGTRWGAWRYHPKLRGRFHPEHPDDLQVIVHDGGPRMSPNPAELVWVRVTRVEDEFFWGQLLNQPHNLKTVRQGEEILFIVPRSGEHPLQVREKYLRERGDWIIHPCNKCGLSELFDAPSDLIRKAFPNTPADAVTSMFTAFCGVCGGIHVVQHKSYNPDHEELASEKSPPKKKWWQFWK